MTKNFRDKRNFKYVCIFCHYLIPALCFLKNVKNVRFSIILILAAFFTVKKETLTEANHS